MRRTKIVCTVGPAIRSPEMIRQVLEAGVDVFRLNFSHGTPDDHRRSVHHIRSAADDLGKPVAILQDLPGPKIRIGTFQHGPVHLGAGDDFTLTTSPVPGSRARVSVNFAGLPEEVRPGQRLLLADGLVELRIEAVEPPDIRCKVILGGSLSDHKGITVPRGATGINAFTEKDRELLLEGLDMGVDMAALSFVRNRDDVLSARKLLDGRGSNLPLMAKIEKPEAVDALDEILPAVDALMVARGDLGVEIPYEDVPLVQKDIIAKALQAARPVVTATQMLRSMVASSRPTRAEAADVANAVLDGSDAVMLSEESATGAYPVEAVRALASIAEQAEARLFQRTAHGNPERRGIPGVSGAISHASCVLALEAGAKAIVCCTRSGHTARVAALHRISVPIIAVSPEVATVRRLALVWGVKPVLCAEFDTTDGMIRTSLDAAREAGGLGRGDHIVIVGGSPSAGPGHTDFVRVAALP
ncbi:MAG: pyruvate kinase [Gemmatimonadota bacterium]|nr:pyruvate kinase [Gemmatimonadota bacterium]